MTGNVSLDQLKQRSVQASELIKKLQKQIEQIKLQTTPISLDEKAKLLQIENEQLKKKVEELKNQLIKKESNQPLVNLTNSKTETTKPEQPKQQKEQQPKQQQQQQQQQQQPKQQQPKQQVEKKSKEEPKKKEEIAPQDINVSCLDFRIGKIVECKKHPDADSLYVEQIDLGEGKLRNVCSGLVKFIPIEQMQNRMVVCLCNLKPSKLRGVLSEAMVMCASTQEKVELLEPPVNASIGDRVTVSGYEGNPVAELNTKNNIFALVSPDLSVNESLIGTYKGIPLEIKGKGPLKSASLKNVPIK